MRVAITHNTVDEGSRVDDQDVMTQVAAVSQALVDLGHRPISAPCGLNLNHIKRQLAWIQPDVVFNLVESLGGEGRLIHLLPALLDSLRLPYTGASTESIWLSSNKLLAKERMVLAGILTPSWYGPVPNGFPSLSPACVSTGDENWIVKSVWEHASLGLDGDSLVSTADFKSLDRILKERAPDLGGACFAEIFVPGREFNLSLLADADSVEVLPAAEIVFEGFEPDRLPIVGYRAKWDAESYEYNHTPRHYKFPPEDGALLEQLKRLALRCWEIFGLRGYARIDFRVDTDGRPWVLEANANPCLSPDAGFAAAVCRSGLSYREAISRIILSMERELCVR